jgi:hypothetical protein
MPSCPACLSYNRDPLAGSGGLYQSQMSGDAYSVICLTDRKLYSPHLPSSRPMPDCFRPPQGACIKCK